MSYLLQRNFFPEFLSDRGHGLRGDAAGDDQIEVAEISVDVQGESVRRDGARDVNSESGDLSFAT